MALHKRKPVKTEPSDFDKKVEKINAEISRQTEILNSLSQRIDNLIESDKTLHEVMNKKTKEATEPEPEPQPEPEPEKPDTTDKKDEHEDKIENA